jgi:GT2 family glycosyltransferase
MNSRSSCAIVTIIIGREFSLYKLLDYFQNLVKPKEFQDLNLYFILGCDDSFTTYLKDKVKEFDLYSRYTAVNFIEGNRRCHPNLDWDEWENYTRKKDTLVKHDSALQNINIGLSSVKDEDYIHFIDDDTIPPYFALDHLLNTYNKVDNCGISSGIYFNKEWLGPTVVTEKHEKLRRIVGSVRKDKWIETSIDDLTNIDFTDIGFVGNGCMLISTKDTKEILPLTENRDYFDTGAPPDSKICYRVRKLGKKISITPSIVCRHLNEKGQPVGLSAEYLNKIKNSGVPEKVLFSNFNPYINYIRLLDDFDKIIITVFSDLPLSSSSIKIKKLQSFGNIVIIRKSIKDRVQSYKDDLELKHDLKVLLTLQEIYSYISDKSEYSVYALRSDFNRIDKVETLDSSNLKRLLNTKI